MGARKSIRRRRRTSGIFLVEILVALILGAILTLGLLQIYGQLMRSSAASQNDQYANLVAQGLFERIQKLPYSTLDSWKGTSKVLKLNLLKTDTSAYSIASTTDIPFSLDFSANDLKWDDKTYYDRFREDAVASDAKATLVVEDGPDSGTSLRLILKLSWHDGQNNNRNIVFGTVVHQSGVKQWPS